WYRRSDIKKIRFLSPIAAMTMRSAHHWATNSSRNKGTLRCSPAWRYVATSLRSVWQRDCIATACIIFDPVIHQPVSDKKTRAVSASFDTRNIARSFIQGAVLIMNDEKN